MTAIDLPMLADGTVRGCCPLDCQDSCSWVAHVQDGVVVRMEGAKDHPVTRGALCAKVNDYQTRTYAPDRILEPLRRVGPKGAGRFEATSWETAIDLIARRLETIIEEDGAEAILPVNYLGSMGVVQRRALSRLFHALGTSQTHGSVCGAAGNILEAEGHRRGFDPELMVEARYVLLWGANLLTTAHHQWRFLDEARRAHGTRIVAIDPLRSRTAASADEHVPIRPGTDAVLAAGIGHVILAEGLSDTGAADAAAVDLAEYRQVVDRWTPQAAAAVTGVPAETIVRVAREFAATRPALIRFGIAPQQSVLGETIVRALSALAILGGHWGLPGGGLYIESGPGIDERRASRPDLLPGDVRSLDLARLGEHLTNEALDPPVRALIVWGMNPAATQPDSEGIRRGLGREDLFTVVLEHFLTDTAAFADIVLPSTTQLEHVDVQGSWGHHYVTANFPAIAPCGGSRSHGFVMRSLAERLGLVHPALKESDAEIASSVLPAGVTLESTRERNWVKVPPSVVDPPARVRIASPIEPPIRPADPDLLQLLTPKSHWFLNTTFGNMPRHRRQMVGPELRMHPDDARRRGLADASRVRISNDRGSIEAHLAITEDVCRGVVALPGKWWASPATTAAVANRLSPAAYSPGGQPAYNDTYVAVTGVSPGTSEGD